MPSSQSSEPTGFVPDLSGRGYTEALWDQPDYGILLHSSMLRAELLGIVKRASLILAATSLSSLAQKTALPDLPSPPQSFSPIVREQVMQAYRQAQASPKDAAKTGDLGMGLQAYSQLEAAEICYRRAHILDPSSFRWTYYLGYVQAMLGKYNDAVVTLRAALAMHPHYQPARLKLAECLTKRGEWEESSSLYEAVLREEPNNPLANFGLGRVEAAKRNWPAAIRLYQKACVTYPNFAAAHYALGLAFRSTGDSDEAARELELYRRNSTSEPSTGDLLVGEIEALNRGPLPQLRLGVELERAGKLNEAVAAHETALAIDPKQVQAHINLITLYGRLGIYDKAQEHFRQAVGMEPNNPEAHYDYGVLLFGMHEYTGAEVEFRKTVEIDPMHAEAHHNLGYLLEQKGEITAALSEYEAAVSSKPNYALAHFHAGRILVNHGDFDRGTRHLLRAATDASDSKPTYLYALGAAYGRAGNIKDAQRYLQEARQQATRLGQMQLVTSIERDLKALEH